MAVANSHGAPASTLVKFGALLFVALWGVGIVLSGMRMNDKAMVSPALPVRKRRTSLAVLQSRGGEDATVLVSDPTRLERVIGPSAVLAESQHVCVQADDNPLVNVTIVTLSTSHLPTEAREAIWRNRVNYAFRHGYRYCDFSTVVDPWRNPKWSKLLAVMSVLPCTGLVLHIDADAIITDTSVRVEDVWRNYNPEGKHVMWSTDYGEQAASPLNSGVYMLAATEWSFQLLRRMYNEYIEKHTAIHSKFPHVKWTDQMAVFDYWEDNKEEFSNNTKLVPYTVFNSWRKKVNAAAGRQLPFIVHYAGIDGTSAKKYDTILKEMRDPAWFGTVHDAWPDSWPEEFTWLPSGGRLVPAPPSGRRWWPAGGPAPQLAYATPMPFALSSEFDDDPQRAEKTELRFVEIGEQHSGVEVEWLRNGDTPVTDAMVLPHLHGGPWVGTPTGPVDDQHCDTAIFTVRKVWRGEWPTEDDAVLVQAQREMEKTVAGH